MNAQITSAWLLSYLSQRPQRSPALCVDQPHLACSLRSQEMEAFQGTVSLGLPRLILSKNLGVLVSRLAPWCFEELGGLRPCKLWEQCAFLISHLVYVGTCNWGIQQSWREWLDRLMRGKPRQNHKKNKDFQHFEAELRSREYLWGL